MSKRLFRSYHRFGAEWEVSKSFAVLLLQGLSSKDELRPADGNRQGARKATENNAQAHLDKWDNSIALKASRRTNAKQCPKAKRKRGPALTFLQIEQFIVIV